MVELKDHHQQEMEGELQFHSHLTLILVPCWSQMHVHVFERLKVCMQGTYSTIFSVTDSLLTPESGEQEGDQRVWSLVVDAECDRRQCHRRNRRTSDLGPHESYEML